VIHIPKIDHKKLVKKNKKHIQSLYYFAILLLFTLCMALLFQVEPASGETTEAVYVPRKVEVVEKPSIPTPTPKIAYRSNSGLVEQRIREIGKELGLKQWEIDRAIKIGFCESGLRTEAKGDGTKSRGVWQIYRPAHPEITDEQAHDLEWSTGWSLTRMKQGSWSMWSCNKLV
jgi:hypothetical protein